MQSVTYQDASQPVRSEFAESHTRFWQRLQKPGSWFSAAERIAIANAVREAGRCSHCQERKQALSPYSVKGVHTNTTDLSPAAVEAVHAIVNDASRLTETWYQELLGQGLSDAEYIEIVGTVVSMVSIDHFAKAIGVSIRPLPQIEAEIDNAQTSRYRPATAALTSEAWVPMLDAENANTPEADLWPSGKTGNVVRAMSLVPDEVRTLKDLSAAHYLEMKKVRQPGVDAGRSLNRSQMELVAGRVSALNQCYY